MTREENTSLLVDLAQDYYLNHLNLGEISDKYNISRYKISKYLTDAIDKQIVNISISSPFLRNTELENKLKIMFPNVNFYILKKNEDIAHENDRFYSFAAKYLQDLIDGKKKIGLTWGDTIYHVINSLQSTSMNSMTFTQFIGINGKTNSLAGSTRVVQKIANVYNSNCRTLNAPLYILNPDVHRLLAKEPAIQDTLSFIQQLDLIFTSLGTLDSIESIKAWHGKAELLFPNINLKNVAGLVYGRPIDKNGQVLIKPVDDKVFGLSLEQILKVPTRIAIVNDKFKAHTLQAAIKGGYFTDVILSEAIVNKLISDI